jgi:hypothetical protein
MDWWAIVHLALCNPHGIRKLLDTGALDNLGLGALRLLTNALDSYPSLHREFGSITTVEMFRDE